MLTSKTEFSIDEIVNVFSSTSSTDEISSYMLYKKMSLENDIINTKYYSYNGNKTKVKRILIQVNIGFKFTKNIWKTRDVRR